MREILEGRDIDIRRADSFLLYSRNEHDIVKQIYPYN